MNLPTRLLGFTFVSCLVLILFMRFPAAGRAQSILLPQFDAASVKPSVAGNLGGSTFEFLPGGGLRITNGTLRAMLETAYEVREFQTIGGPSWVGSEHYDILAKNSNAPLTGTGAENIKTTRLQLQALLAERFKLQVHRETRELPEYALEVAKSGPKLDNADV